MLNLAEEMIQIADGAVQIAKNTYQVELDYSEESIKRMDEIFDSLHKGTPKNFLSKLLKLGLSENAINSAALMLGAYIGEVIRRFNGGEWIREDAMGEKNVLTLKIGETCIFPVGKAYKRIVNGSADDIWFYLRVLNKEIIKSKEE